MGYRYLVHNSGYNEPQRRGLTLTEAEGHRREGAYAVWDNMTKIGRHETRYEARRGEARAARAQALGTDVEMPGVSWCSIGRDHPLPATLLPPKERSSVRFGSTWLSLARRSFFSPSYFSLSINSLRRFTTLYIPLYPNSYLSRNHVFTSLLLVISANIYKY